MPADVEPNVEAMAQAAEKVRAHLGRPMRVLSWYRCPAYNAKVGGAKASQHRLGRALDFAVKDMTPHQVQVKCEELQAQGVIGGLGYYSGFSHIDIGTRRSWTGNY